MTLAALNPFRLLSRRETILSILSAKKPRREKLSNLYVMRVTFEVKEETHKRIQEALEPLREKYGIDFVILEPGITLSRFDEI